MDAFTSNVLPNSLVNVSSDQPDSLFDLIKEINKDEGGPSEEAIAFFEANNGKKVKVNGYIAEIIALNNSTSGFYLGSRYPIMVKIISSEDPKFDCAVGSVFEYDLSNLTVI